MKQFIVQTLVIFAAASVLLYLTGCSAVGPGQRGIRVVMGNAHDEILGSGAHLWLPFVYGVKKIDIQVQKSDVKTSSSSKDMQEITTEIVVNWSLDANKVVETYRNVGDEDDIYEKVIKPAVSEVMKACTAKLTAEEIITKRLELKKDIDAGLVDRLLQYGVKPSDVSIVNLSFSHEFTQAIENKQIAEQRAKQAEYEALQATQTAKAVVESAKGQAKAQELLKSTLTPQILQSKALDKWNGAFPQVMGGGALPFINLNSMAKGE